MNKYCLSRPVWRLLSVCLLASFVLAGCGSEFGFTTDSVGLISGGGTSGGGTSGGGTSGGGLIIGGIGTGGTGVIRSSVLASTTNIGLINAVVFLDKNGNRQPDKDEPQAITDQNGNYALNLEPAEAAAYPLLMQAVVGVSVVKATGQVVTGSYIAELQAPTSQAGGQ